MNYIDPYYPNFVSVKSPNGLFNAEIKNLNEFKMSGPCYGLLSISNGITHEGIGPSIKWSEDSNFLACPELNSTVPEFRIIIFNLSKSKKAYAPGRFGPVTIKEFGKNTLSINNGDQSLTVDISKIIW